MKHLLSATAILWCSASQANFVSGNELYERMKSDNQGIALGYVMGVHDLGDKIHFCTPPQVTAGQVYDVVKFGMDKMPAVRHYPANLVVGSILKKQWPCPKGEGGDL